MGGQRAPAPEWVWEAGEFRVSLAAPNAQSPNLSFFGGCVQYLYISFSLTLMLD